MPEDPSPGRRNVERPAVATGGGPFDVARARPRIDLRPGVLVAIAVGGFVGGVARYRIDQAFRYPVTAFPWSTFSINVSGAFGLAVLLVLALEVWRPHPYLRPALGSGFFGAYTTWSTYMVETDRLVAHHRPGTAAAYVLGSGAAGLIAGAAGLLLARAMFRRPQWHVHEDGS